MTPKEKAQELLSKYTSITLKEVVPDIFLAFDEELCKKFALIAVNEMLNWFKDHSYSNKNYDAFVFYNEVKQEIEAL
jgi:hypothetical protein